MPTKPKGKLPPNTKSKKGVLFNNQGVELEGREHLLPYVPVLGDLRNFLDEKRTNAPKTKSRIRTEDKRQGMIDNPENYSKFALWNQGLDQKTVEKQRLALESSGEGLPELGFGSFLAGFAPKLASAIPIIGSIAGPILETGISIFKGIKANKAAQGQADADQLALDEQAAAQAEQQALADRQTRATNIVDDKQVNYGATFGFGGQMGEGLMGQPQITEYSNGQRHGESATNGIPVDARGNPATTSKSSAVALTEKGEVTWNGYVFSDKLNP